MFYFWTVKTHVFAFLLVTACFAIDSNAEEQQPAQSPCVQSLAGPWQIRMDAPGHGFEAAWHKETFSGDEAALPGTVDTNPRITIATQGNLKDFTPIRGFKGVVWYQRELEVPEAWQGKQITLFLERCQWETIVWVDDKCVGTVNSLVAPHIYDLSAALTPGKHRLTISVDNSNRRTGMEVGADNVIKYYDLTTEVKAGAKLNCGGHHLWSHNWNGIVGRIELQVRDPLHIASTDVYPDIKTGEILIKAKLSNAKGIQGKVQLSATCHSRTNADVPPTNATWEITLNGEKEQTVEQRLALSKPVLLWDEFHPNLYSLQLSLKSSTDTDTATVSFGMRELGREGTHFTMNGRPIFMRATLECFIFPLTGHPPIDVESWRKIIATAKSYGLNMLRFHTCCPPEAAFQAADELGFYFQVEVPGTSCPGQEEAKEVEDFLSAELARTIATYGNHPSYCFESMGNEQLTAWGRQPFFEHHKAALEKKVRYGQQTDPRHLYTATSHPYCADRCDDFFQSAWPAQGPAGTPLCGIVWGGGTVIDRSRFNTAAPETASDYTEGLQGIDRPLMTHEVGQWSVYPDLREITRYHGAKRPYNYEIIRESLRAKGLLELANDFTRASGMLALALYKEEIESALRTPALAGFQLLDLHDFPGQGTSPIGILNAIWESKGLTTPQQFRQFCNPTVLLARLAKRTWTTSETITAKVDVANFAETELKGDILWTLQTPEGQTCAQGKIANCTAKSGGLSNAGDISIPLAAIPSPNKLILRLATTGGIQNTWDLWLYPDGPIAEPQQGITFAAKWDDKTKAILNHGGSVLLNVNASDLKEPVPGTFTTVFWNPQMKNQQVSKTMGILCDPAHPALASFPTEFHSNWQWWDPVMRSAAMRIDGLSASLRPIVRVIDSFADNRQLAMVFEAKVGPGRLLVCSTDLTHDLETRPVAKQLRRSLLDYMAGPLFLPDVLVSPEELDAIFVEPEKQ